MLEVNHILCAAPDTHTVISGIARFLSVDSEYSAYLIRVDKFPLTGPFKVPMLALQSAIESGDVLLDKEIVTPLPVTREALSSPSKEKLEKAVKLLSALLGDEDILFDPKYRGLMFSKEAKKNGVSPRKIRRLYYRYLCGGQNELALAPQFKKRGGRGQEQKIGQKRRGPKAKNELTASLVSLPEVKSILEKGAKQFYLPGNRTLEEAFMETKKKYFSKGGQIEKGIQIASLLLPPEKLPSLGQFRYVCDNLRQQQGINIKNSRRIRQKTAAWSFRGKSRDRVMGPGFRFEIDATKLQIRLVSRYNRAQTLKNPTLFVIIDVWSGAIVGYALSLEEESWPLAAKALYNCFIDKQEVFDRLELDYTSDDWPCHHLPSRLAADRGEMVSNKAGLVPELGIKVEIMPPMCPERKGKVESCIKDIKHGHSLRLPGRHPKMRKRRETDGTDEASLTINDLEMAIVEIIMGLNNAPVPASHVPPEMIEEGHTELTHLSLYSWGVQHYPGLTRTLNPAEARTSLMTKGVASLTPKGLFFKSQTFTSSSLITALTDKPASGKSHPSVNIRYDEHRTDQIWFWDLTTTTWVPAVNCDENLHRRKAAFYELEIYLAEVQRLRRANKDQNLHRQSERDKRFEKIFKHAKEEAKEDKKGALRSHAKKGMRETTILEKEAAALIAAGATNTHPTKNEPKPPKPKDVPGNQATESALPASPHGNDGKAAKDTVLKPSIAQTSLDVWEA